MQHRTAAAPVRAASAALAATAWIWATSSAISLAAVSAALAALSRQANPNAPRKGQDIRVRITLSFDEAVHGCKKNITITRQQECTGVPWQRLRRRQQPRDLPGLRRPRLSSSGSSALPLA